MKSSSIKFRQNLFLIRLANSTYGNIFLSFAGLHYSFFESPIRSFVGLTTNLPARRNTILSVVFLCSLLHYRHAWPIEVFFTIPHTMCSSCFDGNRKWNGEILELSLCWCSILVYSTLTRFITVDTQLYPFFAPMQFVCAV